MAANDVFQAFDISFSLAAEVGPLEKRHIGPGGQGNYWAAARNTVASFDGGGGAEVMVGDDDALDGPVDILVISEGRL